MIYIISSTGDVTFSTGNGFKIRSWFITVLLILNLNYNLFLNSSLLFERANSNQLLDDFSDSFRRNGNRKAKLMNLLSSKKVDQRFISGNDEFYAAASSEGWPGDGSSSDPFIIRDYQFRRLYIAYTSVNFIIRENNFTTISSSPPPVHFTEVENGRVENNIIQTEDKGIHRTGILLSKTQNCTITDNLLFSSHPRRSSHIGYSGIILRNSHYCTIKGNIVDVTTKNGIELLESNFNALSENLINKCSGFGVYTNWSTECNITDNIISYNNGYGIYLGQNSSSFRIGMNDFINNNLDRDSQAFDAGKLNIFSNNYWNDWRKDSNFDGIVDDPYSIDGQAMNMDQNPLSYQTMNMDQTPLSYQTKKQRLLDIPLNILFGSFFLVLIVIWVFFIHKIKKKENVS
jgi:parallel beta-helix repeat protein